MTEFSNNSESSQEATIDIKVLIKKFTGYWYYFILSLSVCLFISFLYNRYTRPIYNVSTTILIEDEKNQPDQVEY